MLLMLVVMALALSTIGGPTHASMVFSKVQANSLVSKGVFQHYKSKKEETSVKHIICEE